MTRSTKGIFLIAAVAAFSALLACEAETGPGAPKRENGCIDLTCAPGGGPDAGSDTTDGG